MKLRKVSLRNHAFAVHFHLTPNTYKGKKEFYEYLKSQEKVIISIINRIDEQNIRTLKYFIDSFFKIYSNLPSDTEPEDIRSMLIFTFICTSEYKKGAVNTIAEAERIFPKDMFAITQKIQIEEMIESSSVKNTLDVISDSKTDKNVEEKVVMKDEQIIFYKKYIEGSEVEYKYYESILRYIIEGILDKNILSREITMNSTTNLAEHARVYQRLLNFRSLTDEDFVTEIQSLKDHLIAGSFSVYELPAIAYSLYYFYENDLLEFQVDEIIDKAIKKSMENYEYNFLEHEAYRYGPSYNSIKYKAIRVRIDQFIRGQVEEKRRKDFEVFFKTLFIDEEIEKKFFSQNYSSPIFNYITLNTLMDYIKCSTNKSIDLFDQICETHFSDPIDLNSLKTEKPTLIALCDALEEYQKNGDAGKIKKYHIGKLINNIKSALKKIPPDN